MGIFGSGAAGGAPFGVPGMIAGGLGSALLQGFSGQDQINPGKLHSRWADPYQGQLFQQQMRRAMSGAGDFGFGQAAKEGKSQLQQMLADRGIAPDSGVAASATGSMLANALGQDTQNRRSWIGNLLRTQPMKQTSNQGWENYASYGRWGEPVNAPRHYSI